MLGERTRYRKNFKREFIVDFRLTILDWEREPNLPYNILDFFTAHETGGPKYTLPQRRKDAKFRRVALRNFAPWRLRGEREFKNE
jgi:hypothetical protein